MSLRWVRPTGLRRGYYGRRRDSLLEFVLFTAQSLSRGGPQNHENP